MPNMQVPREFFIFILYQRLNFQGAYNAPRGPPHQSNVAQSFPPLDYNDLDKVKKKVKAIEGMIRT